MFNTKLLTQSELPKVLEWYEWLHQNPELSGKEENTSNYIVIALNRIGISKITKYAKTGIVGEIQGKRKGKHIAIRAELDAIPVTEHTGVSYTSKNQGIMHACGHDFHIATLLGLISILSKNREHFSGKVTFIFQPSEEVLPGGAIQMLNEGIFDNEKPDLLLAQHVIPDLPSGTIALKSGAYMASSDEIEIKVCGKGGHAAIPHLVDDVVLALSQTIVALQQVKSRFLPSNEPFVLSFGKLEALGATNIIPNTATARGTMRTLNEDWRTNAKQQIIKIVENVSEMYGCKGIANIKEGYPVLYNSKKFSNKICKFGKELLGENQIVELPVRMTADDFSYFAQIIPSVYFRTGVAPLNAKEYQNLHTDTFLPDTSAFSTVLYFLLSIIMNNEILD